MRAQTVRLNEYVFEKSLGLSVVEARFKFYHGPKLFLYKVEALYLILDAICSLARRGKHPV